MVIYSTAGHVTLDERGTMLAADDGFCALLGLARDELIGRCVLDVTAPRFRPGCAGGMAALRTTGEPFVVTKQMIRGDGSLTWVTQTNALSTLFADAAILATFVGVRVPEDRREPRALLANARFLSESGAARDLLFGKVLMANPCWDLLLAAYIAEAEGRTADAAGLARTIRTDVGVTIRWMRAMTVEGLLEIENVDAPPPEQRYRMSASSHARFERFLTSRLARLGGLGIAPVPTVPDDA